MDSSVRALKPFPGSSGAHSFPAAQSYFHAYLIKLDNTSMGHMTNQVGIPMMVYVYFKYSFSSYLV